MVFDADEKKSVEYFQMLKNLFEMTHVDNMKVLKALVYAKDDIRPLIDGSSKKRVRSSTISSFYVTNLMRTFLILPLEFNRSVLMCWEGKMCYCSFLASTCPTMSFQFLKRYTMNPGITELCWIVSMRWPGSQLWTLQFSGVILWRRNLKPCSR